MPDATREAIPPESLEGITLGASSPVDANNDSDALYRAVMETYGDDIQLRIITTMVLFGQAAEDPAIDPAAYLKPEAHAAASAVVAEHCLPDIISTMIPFAVSPDFYVLDPMDEERSRTWMEDNDPAQAAVDAPLLLFTEPVFAVLQLIARRLELDARGLFLRTHLLLGRFQFLELAAQLLMLLVQRRLLPFASLDLFGRRLHFAVQDRNLTTQLTGNTQLLRMFLLLLITASTLGDEFAFRGIQL